MWGAACALISCGYTTLGRASSPDLISNNLNNINDLKFYHEIRGNLRPKGVAQFRQAVVGKLAAAQDTLTALSQEMFGKLVEEFVALEAQLAYDQEKLDTLAATH